MTLTAVTASRRLLSCAMIGIALFGATMGAAPPARSAPAPMDAKNVDLTIYHIEQRRSFRIIWLCEELGIPYKLAFRRGDIAGSMEDIKKVSPLMPMAPTVDFRGQILVESGGIIETLLAYYGNGRLVPPKSSPDLAYHYQWLHFAEGTGMFREWAARYAAMVAKIPIEQVPRGYEAGVANSGPVGVNAVFVYMNDFLGKHPYFGGKEFSAADIMMHFVSVASKITAGVDSTTYPNIAAWRKRVQERPAFKRAMNIALPDGYDEDLNACGLSVPFANPPRVYCK